MLLLHDQLLLLLDLVLLLRQLHLLLLADLRKHSLLLIVFWVVLAGIVNVCTVFIVGLFGVATFARSHVQHLFTVLAVADLSALLNEPEAVIV
jgi:hypothetical protein